MRTVKHHAQRYNTTGDWLWHPETGTLEIIVSDHGDWRMNMATALHEQVEAFLCIQRGIKETDVKAWDDLHDFNDRGDDPDAPYADEHCFANSVENLFTFEVGLDDALYNDIADCMYEECW